MPTNTVHRALFLTGGDGAGKTTLGQELGCILTGAGYPTAVIDLDAISQFGPAPADRAAAGEPSFHDLLRVRNVAALWTTYRAAGAQYVVLSGAVDKPPLHALYQQSLSGCELQLVRVTTPPDLIDQRNRYVRPGWNLQHRLATHANLPSVENFTVTNDRPLPEVATEILHYAGWPSDTV